MAPVVDGVTYSGEDVGIPESEDDGVFDDVCSGSTSGEIPLSEGTIDADVEIGVPVQKIGLLE